MSVILATAGYDKKIRFWEAPSGICSRTLRYPDSQVNCLEITPDKKFLAAGGNPHIRLFEIYPSPSSSSSSQSSSHGQGPPPPSPQQQQQQQQQQKSQQSQQHPNGGGGGGGGNHHTSHPHNDPNNPINNNDPTNSTPVLQCEGHTSSVTCIGFQRDGRWMYSSSEDHTVKLWDLRSSTYSHSFDCGAPVNTVALHPSQTYLISGDQNGSIKIWDLGAAAGGAMDSKENRMRPMNELMPEDSNVVVLDDVGGNLGSSTSSSTSSSRNRGGNRRSSIQSVDISEDGRLAMAASNHANVYLWDPTDMSHWIPLRKFRAHYHGAYLLKAKISPDGRHLVTTSSDKTAKLWNTQQLITKLTTTTSSSSSSEMAPPKVSKLLEQHQRWVWDAVFSADSGYLVTACSDHWARLWNLQTGEVVRQYTGHRSAVTCVALNDSST